MSTPALGPLIARGRTAEVYAWDEITTWMVPVAAGRLKEGIAEEQEPLLKFIEAHLSQQ